MITASALISSIRPVKGSLVALAGAALMMAACQREPSTDHSAGAGAMAGSNQAPEVEASPAAADKPVLLAIGRSDLIDAIALAADATAAGRPLPDANRQLVGRTFTFRLPFGCNGPASQELPSWAGWTFDQSRQTLKLSAAPERWGEAGWVKSIAGDMAYEAVEGFWIERPWTSSEKCPVGGNGSNETSEAVVDRPTVGIAQFFAPDTPRTFQRRSRAYSHTIRLRDSEEIEGQSYHLYVSGRVTGFADGQPIHCWQETPDIRPVCLMAVEFARIAFEDSPGANILAEWRN